MDSMVHSLVQAVKIMVVNEQSCSRTSSGLGSVHLLNELSFNKNLGSFTKQTELVWTQLGSYKLVLHFIYFYNIYFNFVMRTF